MKPMKNEKLNMKNELSDIVEIKRLTPENSEFYITKGGFLGVKIEAEDKGRVGLFRMTPITKPNSHISVRDMDAKELGIVFNMGEFSGEQQKIMGSPKDITDDQQKK